MGADAVSRRVEEMGVPEPRRTAFAIGGLGGNNAHGAGFLAAAQELQRERQQGVGVAAGGLGADGGSSRRGRGRAGHTILPELEFISCTSGAIAATATYLKGDDVREATERSIEQADRASCLPRNAWADNWRGVVLTLLTGVPDVFGPWVEAYREHWWQRLVGFVNPRSPFYGAVPTNLDEFLDLWFPAQTLVPELPETFFQETAEVFTDTGHGVGVAFNSFDPKTGIEQLYVNDAALRLIAEHYDPQADYGRTHRHTLYQRITPESVQAALWLVNYGFPSNRLGADRLVDGAYARSMILNEVTAADRIFAVKPTNDRWIGRLPQNVFDVLDMQTQFWWEASYREQSRLIETINDLRVAGRLTDPPSQPEAADLDDRHPDRGAPARLRTVRAKPYRELELIPVEISMRRGYFDYFVESREVFRQAYAQSLQLLTRLDEQAAPATSDGLPAFRDG
jgi:hypothetical protein